MVDAGYMLVAGTEPSYGFFPHDDPRGEVIGGLVYVLLPMAVSGLLCRLAFHLWTMRKGRRPKFGPGPASAIIGVLSYYGLAVIYLWGYRAVYKSIFAIFLVAALFTWPVVVIIGPILLLYIMHRPGGKSALADYIIYAACLACAVLEYLYIEGFADT